MINFKTLISLICLIVGLFFAVPAFSTILLYEDFEDELDFTNTWGVQENDGSLGVSTEQARTGSKSYKFSVTCDQRWTPESYGDDRTEILMKAKIFNGDWHLTIGNEYWFGFSLFLADGYYTPEDENGWDLHFNLHDVPDGPPRCEEFEDWGRGAVFQVQTCDVAGPDTPEWLSRVRYDSAMCNAGYEGSDSDSHGAYSTGSWIDFVINLKLDYDDDGFCKIWKNGELIRDYSGGTCYNDVKGPYLKIGIYSRVLDQDQIVTIYYDEFRIGDESSSYAEVAPGGCTLPTLTTEAVDSVGITTATGHGTITNTGGENATKRGICWNVTGSPTVADDKTVEEGDFSIGSFDGTLTALTSEQHYYVKSYAYNSGGYGYGNVASFDTLPSEGGTYIIDNGDNGTSSNGTWESSGVSDYYGVGSLYSDGVATYTWEKTLDGNYTAYMWWPAYANRPDNATVEIYDSSGENLLDTVYINQQINGGQWNILGIYDFNATAEVKLISNDAEEYASADAVKFDYVEGEGGGGDGTSTDSIRGLKLRGCKVR